MTGVAVPVTSKTLWTWDTSGPVPLVTGYNGSQITKTGLMPDDLQNYVGVPLQYYGNPPRAVASGTVIGWIRAAEDFVEQQTTILLTPTWVASPPSPTNLVNSQIGLTSTIYGGQQMGKDYDLEDAPYDFVFQKAQNEGWSILQYRYRPLRNFAFGVDRKATKLYAYIYPLACCASCRPRTCRCCRYSRCSSRSWGLPNPCPARSGCSTPPVYPTTITAGASAS